MSRLRARVRRLEQRANLIQDGLNYEDRVLLTARHAHAKGLATAEQRKLLDRTPWERIQEAYGRPGFARLCIAAMERARAETRA